VITIDGPAGAGKSTVAQALAQRLGYRLLDTGAMYRALAWSVERAGLTAEDTPALRRHLSGVEVDVRNDRVHVDGRDVSGEIRTRAIDRLTSMLTTLEPVRQKLTPLQRRLAATGGVILEGRDTGTVVCPEAEVKFFLDASLEERARRRQAQFQARGSAADFATVLEEIRARDAQDRSRALAPLTRAPNAVAIDTTDLTVEQIVERMVREIEGRCSTRS
jgi:cytidylate kinase